MAYFKTSWIIHGNGLNYIKLQQIFSRRWDNDNYYCHMVFTG